MKKIKFIMFMLILFQLILLVGCGVNIKETSKSDNLKISTSMKDKNFNYVKNFAEAIKEENWDRAKTYIKYGTNNEEITSLSYLTEGIECGREGSGGIAEIYFNKISVNYNGVLNEAISKYRMSQNKEPQIGWDRYQVELSTWGFPSNLNSSKTSNKFNETWEYKDYGGNIKTIYLENGIVTEIKQ